MNITSFYDYDDDYDDEEEYAELDCTRCGPWCDAWLGDGLCEYEIDYLSKCQEFYDKYFTTKEYICPICSKKMTLYKVPSKLWQWPGDWLSPIIALTIYAAYDCPKGVIHSFGQNLHHVWIGAINERECLIETNCPRFDPDENGLPFRWET